MNASNKRRIDKKNVAFIRGRRLIMFLLVLAAFIPRRRLFVRYIQRRRKQSRAGGGGGGVSGSISKKGTLFYIFTLANKQKDLTLKNSLTLLNLYD